ncbi:MAG: NAD(P)-dependent oxidoreductase [Deltaproteobacteria bacterium]|nr:NAD(P)-dependent oxidoreductase [Deltaproteobacteria bacterium]
MVNIGFIGTGMMGNRMARNLIKADFQVSVFDINKEAYQDLIKMGASAPATIADLTSRSDILISMVNDDKATVDVFMGEKGVIQGVTQSKKAIVMSTISPNTIRKIAEQIEKMAFLDAPVSGGPIRAENATLSIMVSGDFSHYENCSNVLKAMGNNVYYVGSLGSAITIKLINNILGLGNLLMTIEEMNLARKAGMDLEKLAEVVNVSSGSNFYLSDWAESKKAIQFLTSDPANLESFLQTYIKDIKLAETFAAELGFTAPVLRMIKDAVTKIETEKYRQQMMNLIM